MDDNGNKKLCKLSPSPPPPPPQAFPPPNRSSSNSSYHQINPSATQRLPVLVPLGFQEFKKGLEEIGIDEEDAKELFRYFDKDLRCRIVTPRFPPSPPSMRALPPPLLPQTKGSSKLLSATLFPLLIASAAQCSGSIEFDELLEGIAPPPNPRRRALIMEAFKVSRTAAIFKSNNGSSFEPDSSCLSPPHVLLLVTVRPPCKATAPFPHPLTPPP